MKPFIISMERDISTEEIEALMDQHGDEPGTPNISAQAYLTVWSDDIYWVRDRDAAMIFEAPRGAFFEWAVECIGSRPFRMEHLEAAEIEEMKLKQDLRRSGQAVRARIGSLESRLAGAEMELAQARVDLATALSNREKQDELWKHVKAFVQKQNITCSETVYQTDRVIINAYEFIDRACEIVGFAPRDDEDDE
jgi:hypothetical protein